MENGNPQPASVATPPPSPAPSAEELQAKIAELEKQNEGRLRDLQAERQKRHDLESRMNQPVVPSAPPAAPSGAPQDELGKVLDPYLKTAVAPLEAKVRAAEAFVRQTYEDKAMDYLSSKTGKSKEAILNDKAFQDKLVAVARKYGFIGNAYDITVKAYEVMDLENLRAAEESRRRAAAADNSSSLPAGSPPPPVVGSKTYSEKDFNAMPLEEYERLSSQGSFEQNEQGQIVFKPSR